MRGVRAFIVALLAVAVILAVGYYRLAPSTPERVPDLALVSLDGENLQLTAYAGRPLLVVFWATTCPSCVREIPHLSALYRELAPRGLEIIAIAMAHDPPNRVLEMRKSRAIPYPVTLDIQSEAARAFGNIHLTPTTFLIAPDGRIARRRTGSLDMARLRGEILAMLADRQPAPSALLSLPSR